MPSRWTTKVRRGSGLKTSRNSSSRSAFVQRSMFFRSSSIPATTSSIPLKISGSPPQIETTGAGHWTPESMHSSTESRALFDSYSRIFPQPMQAMLQASVGSSMRTSG